MYPMHCMFLSNIDHVKMTSFKLDLYDLKQLTNTLKIRIMSETSILYLILYASIILIVGRRL